MNNLENHVTSLELSKQLKELGVKQESIFAYYREGHYWCAYEEFEPTEPVVELYVGKELSFPNEFVASAFLATELWEVLPKAIEIEDKFYWKVTDAYFITFETHDKPIVLKSFEIRTNLADSAAQALIWCIKEGFVEMKGKDE